LGRQIFEAVDAGELTEDEAGMLVRSFLSAGIDTTVYGLGNALYCMTRYPDQWRALRENPALIRGAFEEVLRFEAPVQSFFRTTTGDVEAAALGCVRARRCCCCSRRPIAIRAAGTGLIRSTSAAAPPGI
jgi:hypothetical protein